VRVSGRDTDTVARAALDNMGGLDRFLERNVALGTVILASTDPAMSYLPAFDVWNAFLGNAAVSNKIAGYWALRGDMVVTAMVSSAATYFGLYNVEAVCAAGTPLTSVMGVDNAFNSTQDVHALMNLAQSNSVELELPFVSDCDAYCPTDGSGATNWRINVWCLAPVRDITNIAGAPTATITFYGRFKPGYILSIPNYQMKKGTDDRRISKGLGMASKISAGVAAVVPTIAPFAAAVSAGLAAASSVASALGFTKESDPVEPMPMTRRNFCSLTTTDGKDCSVPLSLINGASTSIDPRIGGGENDVDPMAYGALFSRPTVINFNTWTEAMTSLTVLATIPVTPMFGAATGGATQLPVAGYVGLPFSQWRGTMRYEIFIAASNFHRGKLQVVWTPTTGTMAHDPTNSTWNCIMDLDVEKSRIFRVGWGSNQLTKACVPRVGTGTLNAAENNGYLTLLIHTPLKSQAGNSTVYVFTAVSCEDDMRFGVPRVGSWSAAGTYFEAGVQVQGQIGDGEVMEDVCDLAGVSTQYPLVEAAWGECVGSVRPLMQKMSLVGNAGGLRITTTAGTGVDTGRFTTSIPFIPRIDSTAIVPTFVNLSTGVVTMNTPWFSWYAYYARLFVGVRGGMRIKVVMTRASNLSGSGTGDKICVFHFRGKGNEYDAASIATTGAWAPGISMLGHPFFSGVTGDGVEVQIPFSHDKKFINPAMVATRGTDLTGKWIGIVIDMSLGAGGWAPLYIFQGGSSDTTAIRFRKAFPLTITVASSGTLFSLVNPDQDGFATQQDEFTEFHDPDQAAGDAAATLLL